MKIKLSDILIFLIGGIVGYVVLTYTLNTMKFVEKTSPVAKSGIEIKSIVERH